MYGINFLKLTNVLAKNALINVVCGKNGAVAAIVNQMQRAIIENDIGLLKAMIRSISAQNQEVFKEIDKILKENLSDEDYRQLMNL